MTVHLGPIIIIID